MDQAVKTFTSADSDARKWIGRIIIAVILGEAIWGLIVSVMNNLVVPWLGDVVGQSSGLPASFTQRPYDYPDLFISIVEFSVAGLMALILNYFFQRQRAGRVKPVKSVVASAPVERARVIPEAVTAVAKTASPVVVPSSPKPLALRSNRTASGALPDGPIRAENRACRQSASRSVSSWCSSRARRTTVTGHANAYPIQSRRR